MLQIQTNTSILDLVSVYYDPSLSSPEEKMAAFKRLSRKKADIPHSFACRGAFGKDPLIDKYLLSFFSAEALPLYFVFEAQAQNNGGIEMGRRFFAYALQDGKTAEPNQSFTERFLSLVSLLNIPCCYNRFQIEYGSTVADRTDDSLLHKMAEETEEAYSGLNLKVNFQKRRYLQAPCSAVCLDPDKTGFPEHHPQYLVRYRQQNLYLVL